MTDTVQELPGDLAAEPPLCVDLDGTLVRSDMLVEGLLAIAGTRHLHAAFTALLKGGRPALKRSVATAALIDLATLPFNEDLLSFLLYQKARGRVLVLVTASDMTVARTVAEHLNIFDEIIATDSGSNLKGARKAQVLIDRYGRNGFDYAGDSRADLHVWSAARSGILVNVDRFTRANARKLTSIDRTFTDVRTGWREVVRAMRPHQWTKNLLVFVPLVASGGEVGVSTVARLLAAFVAFCMVASAIYVFNDLLDLRADRAHPRKRLRPFARGSVLPQTGLVACALLLVAGVALASVSGVVSVVAIYALLSMTYSAKLKELPLVDVFLLAGLYSIRMIGGGVASERPISLWLLAFSSFLFLGLALVKRVSELKGAPAIENRPVARRGYSAVDLSVSADVWRRSLDRIDRGARTVRSGRDDKSPVRLTSAALGRRTAYPVLAKPDLAGNGPRAHA